MCTKWIIEELPLLKIKENVSKSNNIDGRQIKFKSKKVLKNSSTRREIVKP